MWLLSAGKDPEQNVVIWDVATCTALASGTTSQPVLALAWRSTTTLPAFVTLSKVRLTCTGLVLLRLLIYTATAAACTQGWLAWYRALSGACRGLVACTTAALSFTLCKNRSLSSAWASLLD